MEEKEAVTNVRRTRSGKVVRTPPAKSVAKPATRRTRKKVVLMEVEVSDDEDETVPEAKIDSEDKGDKSDQEEDQKVGEKLLETPDESNDESTEPKKEDAQIENSKEEAKELNGSENSDEAVKDINDDSITFVLNDIEMFEVADLQNDTTKSEIQGTKAESEALVMEVDEANDSLKKKAEEITIEPVEAKKTSPKKRKTEFPPEKSDVARPNKKDRLEEIETKEEDKTREAVDGGETVEFPKEMDELKESDDKQKKVHEAIDVTEDKETADEEELTGLKVIVEEPVSEEDKDDTERKENDERKKKKKAQAVSEIVEINEVSDSDDDADVKMKTKPEREATKEANEVKGSEGVTESEEVKKSEEATVGEEVKKSEDVAEAEKVEKTEEVTEGEKVKESKEAKEASPKKEDDSKQNGDPDAENISEDELPGVPVVKVPEAEEVSDEELPGPKRAELPADTEVVSEDELPTVKSEAKKEGVKRKLDQGDYDPGSPTSENEAPTKKPSLEATPDKEKEEKLAKPKKLPELDKYWKAVNDDPTDFTGWTYLLQYVDQENDMEAAREAYDAFLSHYPYCYGYWRKYADYEKRKGNKKKCEEVFERGLKAIPLSVDLWIHYLTYVKTSRPEDEDFIRSQFERAILACGLEFRSDRLWDSYIKWETESKRLQKVTAIYDRLLATPTQGYTTHFDNFQEHISSNPPNKVVEVDEFLALRKEVRHMLKHDVTTESSADNSDAPPGDEDQSKVISSDEETKSIRERIVSIRRKIHKSTVNAVTARWNYEEGIKRPYFHVKPLERCQLKNWQDYLDYETEQGDRSRIIVLFERCLIACALYEEFWMKFVHYLEELKDPELQAKIRDVYERACTIHHLKKPNLHLQWAMFEESVDNCNRAAEILVNLEKSVPNVLQIAYRRINLERRRGDHEKCSQLYEHYISNSKNKMISSNIAIKYSRFCLRVAKNLEKAQEVLKTAIAKDPNNPRLYLQLIDLTLQKENVTEAEIVEVIDSFLEKDTTDPEQKVLFAQRKLEYLEDFGTDIQSVQVAYDQYQKYIKQNKENAKKKEPKSETSSVNKKEKSTAQSSSQSGSYGNYGNYSGGGGGGGASSTSSQPSYPYSGSQQGQYNYSQYGQGDQYQYQNWQYPQGGYGGYNQWGGYGGGYGY